MPKRTNKKSDNLSFEEAYSQLEQTVRALEEGGVALEEATRLFEDGMRLARICQQHLSATELKITHLQRSFGEQMEFIGEKAAEGDGVQDY